MKNLRHEKILELIEKYEIETQEELVERLADAGIAVGQSTVSRDIKNLNLIKVTGSHGQYKYATHSLGKIHAAHYSSGLSGSILSIDHSANLVVIKTIPGMASAMAAYVDNLRISDILGSIAGDDTVLIITRSEAVASQFGARIEKLLTI